MLRKRAAAQPNARQRIESIGGRVAQARRRLGVTLERDISAKQLAQMAGVPPSTVTRIEKGESEDPEDATLRKLAAVLNVSVPWLRYGAEAALQVPVKPPIEG